jgi:hypothetical protein
MLLRVLQPPVLRAVRQHGLAGVLHGQVEADVAVSWLGRDRWRAGRRVRVALVVYSDDIASAGRGGISRERRGRRLRRRWRRLARSAENQPGSGQHQRPAHEGSPLVRPAGLAGYRERAAELRTGGLQR